MITQEIKFNCAPDLPDSRDFQFQPPASVVPPVKVDLRTSACGFPPIYDQGQLNSCTANAVAAVLAYDIRRQKQDPNFEPSRLFVYYNERYAEHLIGQPSYGNHGAPAYMRDCIQTVDSQGFCSETDWPYDQSKFDTRPPDNDYQLALEHRACEYRRIAQDVNQLKACLAGGDPFVCGIIVRQSFTSPMVQSTGTVPMPAENEITLGGHAIAVVGYDDAKQWFIFRNSFGTGWGDQGHGTIPYAYLADQTLAMDFWMLRKVQETLSGDGNGGSQTASASTSKTTALGDAAGLPDLAPALSQPVTLVGTAAQLTAPQWVPDEGCFLFSDGKAVHAVSDDCLPLWTIPTQYQLNGWAVSGSSLFIQDGCILTQYNMDALIQNAKAAPDCAINLKTHVWWSAQTSPASGYQALFTGCSGPDLQYSAPVVMGNSNGSPTIFLMSGNGMIIPLPANLQVDPSKVYQSSYKPDTLNFFLFNTANGNVLSYLSGGQVVTLSSSPVAVQTAQKPAGTPAQWIALSRTATTQGQPWISMAPGGIQYSALASTLNDSDSSPKILLSIIDRSASQCTVFLMDSKTTGLVSGGGRLTAQGGASVGLPLLLSAPCMMAEGSAVFLFALTQTQFSSGTVQFQKYKVTGLAANPSAQTGWTLFNSEFKAAQQWTSSGATGTAVPFDDPSALVGLGAAMNLCAIPTGGLNAQLQSAGTQASSGVISIIKSAGSSLGAASLALQLGCNFSSGQIFVILKSDGYGPADIVSTMPSFGLNSQDPGQIATTLKTAGYSILDIATYLKSTGMDVTVGLCRMLQNSGASANDAASELKSAGFGAQDVVTGLIASYCPMPRVDYREDDADEVVFELKEEPDQIGPVIALGTTMQAAGYNVTDAAAGMAKSNMDPILTAVAILKGYPSNDKNQNERAIYDAYPDMIGREGDEDDDIISIVIDVEIALDMK